MNITELIVSLLKSGQTVEMNGIGSFTPKTQDAYMDEATGTFYPKKQTVEFQPYTEDKGNIISLIARKECVDENTAAKMWKNFSDALIEKLQKQHSHTFTGIGEMHFDNGNIEFHPEEDLNLLDPNHTNQPLQGVEMNNVANDDDPFAVFDNPQPEQEEQPEPAENADETMEPVEPEPESTTEEAVENDNNEAETPTEESLPEAEPVIIAPVYQNETEPVNPTEEPSSPALPAEDDEKETDAPADTQTATTNTDDLHNILDDEPDIVNNKNKKNEKKGDKGIKLLLILLIILLLLCMGAAAYYYFFILKKSNNTAQISQATSTEDTTGNKQVPSDDNTAVYNEDENTADADNSEQVNEGEAQPADNTAETGTAPQVNVSGFDYSQFATPFSYDPTLVEIDDPNAIEKNRNAIITKINNRLENYLRNKQYSTATGKMKEKLTEFIDTRLDEKLNNTNTYHIANFLTHKDFVKEAVKDELKIRKQTRARYEIIDEIFTNGLFDEYLNELIANGEVSKDVVKAVVPAAPVYTAPVYSASKQGFDVIAGTYKDKNSAMKLASTLRKKGADGYVIKKGDFYYVSAGSAPSRTAIEKVMFQLKTWYTSNLAIKQL